MDRVTIVTEENTNMSSLCVVDKLLSPSTIQLILKDMPWKYYNALYSLLHYIKGMSLPTICKILWS